MPSKMSSSWRTVGRLFYNPFFVFTDLGFFVLGFHADSNPPDPQSALIDLAQNR